ncbi:MAG: hypothetical protein ABI402_09815 [Ferruginibacter sp.]
MVQIEKEGSDFIFEIKGLHKLWALKSKLTIPAEHIISANHYNEKSVFIFGLHLPGTQIPGIITAGTFIVKDGTIFCDMMDVKKSIEVQLHDEHYKRLVIEVEDPEVAIALLNKK